MSEKSKMTVYLDEEKPSFLVLTNGIEATKAIVRTNLGGEPIRVTDLDRAVNPAGKSTKWEIPGLGDEAEQASEITGVVLCQQPYRIYWKVEFKGGGSPPDCISIDTIHGQGSPGGECAKCPFNEWGSGKTPNSKACSFRRRVFILRPEEMLPMQLTLSPINAGALKTYGLRLMNKRQLQLHHVTTRVSLQTATSKNGFEYAKAVFALVDVLPRDVAEAMDNYKHFLEPQLLGMQILDEPAQQPEEDVPF